MPTASPPVPRYRVPSRIGEHMGIVTVTGSLTVDLGLDHNKFIVDSLLVKGGLSAISDNAMLAWDYGTKLGTFVITVAKNDASFGPLIANAAAKSISFHVTEATPVTF